MHIGITGHRGLPEDTTRLVVKALADTLAPHTGPELVGISILADGADQLFARAVLDAGGRLEVIVPATAYRAGLPASCHAEYDALLAAAVTVTRLPHAASTSESHMDASRLMLDRINALYTIWDGQPARAYGGTADVVAEARGRGIPVTVIWPDGACREA
jgi:hypothetical protein